MNGQMIMPLIINTDGHIGMVKSTSSGASNQTENNLAINKTKTIRAVWKNGAKISDGPVRTKPSGHNRIGGLQNDGQVCVSRGTI